MKNIYSLILILLNFGLYAQIEGLIRHYPLDGNAIDVINQQNGTLNGGVTPTTDRFNNVNSAYQFNGTDGFISIPLAGLQLTNYTYSAWVMLTDTPSVGGNYSVVSIGSARPGNASGGDQFMSVTNTNLGKGFAGHSYYNHNDQYIVIEGEEFTLDSWFHLTLIRSNNKLSLYVNCELVAVDSTNNNTQSEYGNIPQARIGARQNNTYFFNGKIDDVKFYDRAIEMEFIEQEYFVDVFKCKGEEITLSPSGGDSYIWNDGSLYPTLTVADTGVYTVEFTGTEICNSKVNYNVKQANPSSEITGLSIFCEGDSILLYAQEGYSEYLWSNGASTESTYVYGGETSLIVTDAYGCKDTTTVILEPISNPTANFNENPENSVFLGDSTIFIDLSTSPNNIPITAWQWIFGDGEESDMQNPDHLYLEPGTYNISLIVTNLYGCKDTIEIAYHVLEEKEDPVVPNVFTPNGDGINDFFEISNIQHLNNVKFVVYNRWGQIVYESNNYNNTWDGAGNADGIYFYILEIPTLNIYKGFLTIVRN